MFQEDSKRQLENRRNLQGIKIDKHIKQASISFLMMICVAILMTSCVMLNILIESYTRKEQMSKAYQDNLITASVYDVVAEGLIEVIDGKEGQLGNKVFEQSDLYLIQDFVENYTNEIVEVTLDNLNIEDALSIKISISYNSCTYLIQIDNIELEAWQVEDIDMYKIHTDNCNITIKRV